MVGETVIIEVLVTSDLLRMLEDVVAIREGSTSPFRHVHAELT